MVKTSKKIYLMVIIMKEFLKLLRPLKFKIIIEQAINCLIISLILGFSLNIAFILISKFTFIQNLTLKVGLNFGFSFLIGLIILFIKKPTPENLAAAADFLGFDERFITTYELLKTRSDYTIIQKLAIDDGLEKASNANFIKLYKLKIDTKKYMALSLLIIITIVCLFIPTFKADEINKQIIITEKVNKEIEKLDKISTETKTKEIKKSITELKKELKKAKSEAQAIKSIQKSQQNIKSLEVNHDLKEIAQKLAENELTKEFGESLKSSPGDELIESLKEFKTHLENMTSSDLKKLGQNMSKLADEISESNELKELFKDLAKSLESLNSTELDKSLTDISNTLEKLSNQNKELREAINKTNQTLTEAINDIKPISQANKSTKAQASNMYGNTSIPNENKYDRQLENSKGTDFKLEGKLNERGNLHQTEVKAEGDEGEIVTYQKAYTKYQKEALKSLDNDDIPALLKDLVKDYFSSLD